MTRARSNRAPGLAIVTGASSGLGRALADRLAADGCDLFLVARDRLRLEDCATAITRDHDVTVHVIQADLTDPDGPHAIFDRLHELGLTADVLVNDAGFNVYGRFEESDLEREIEMIKLHLIATTQLTKLFLRARDRARRNRVLNVSSIAALVPGPFVSVHFATRAHLLSFSLALSEEFRGTDVDVTCLCPGPMQTPFFARAGMQDVRLARGIMLKTMTPAEVARNGYDAMMSGRRMIVPGGRNRLFALAADIAPRFMKVRFTRWIMGRS